MRKTNGGGHGESASVSASGRLGWFVALSLAVLHVIRSPTAGVSRPLTGTSRQKNTDGAFVLMVDLKFKTSDAAKELLKEWTKVADWCRRNEPELYHYEISQSDKDELRYGIVERYRSKDDYFQHKTSAAFTQFRPKMQALQDAGLLEVTGSSYFELGHGFVPSHAREA
jgi:quinol monooxygenase YgiN